MWLVIYLAVLVYLPQVTRALFPPVPTLMCTCIPWQASCQVAFQVGHQPSCKYLPCSLYSVDLECYLHIILTYMYNMYMPHTISECLMYFSVLCSVVCPFYSVSLSSPPLTTMWSTTPACHIAQQTCPTGYIGKSVYLRR